MSSSRLRCEGASSIGPPPLRLRHLSSLHALPRLLVLETELVDQLRVELDRLAELHRPRTRVRLGIVYGQLHVEGAVIRPAQSFDHLRRVTDRAAFHVDPHVVAE